MRKLFLTLSVGCLLLSSCGSKDDMGSTSDVVINFPTVNAEVMSPLEVNGEAPGTWFFEATAEVRLVDQDGNVLAEAPAMTTEDWQTTEMVSFTATLEFDAPEDDEEVTFVFAAANPSGLPENEKIYEFPVKLMAQEQSSFFESWEVVSPEQFGFNFELPELFEPKSDPQGLSYIYVGDTQVEGTEVYDGIIIGFSSEDLPDDVTLDEFVRLKYDEDKNSDVGVGVSDGIEEADFNGLDGQTVYHYVFSSLGEIEKYFFLSPADDVILVTVLNPDPENLGYARETQRILNSIEY